jgi:enoyl-CoA hydratase/carnithine racemase
MSATLGCVDDVSYEHLVVKRDGDIVTITLDRPEKRNALSVELMEELIATLEAVGRSDALGVVIAANGPVFSAGHNFADMVGVTFEAARRVFDVCARMMQTIQAIPQPVCAKVHALATAAGCQLVAMCDLAIAAESAGFATPGGKGGLFCHTPLVAVARNVGRKRALEMGFTGDVIDAATAADWGLINRAVPDDELDAAVDDLMARATRGSPAGKALGKRAFYTQIDLDQDKAYEYATEVMAADAAAADAQEGITAFLEKRKPRFAPPPWPR